MKGLEGPLGEQRFATERTVRRDDMRSPWQRDRARILHSAAFRRLQSKTQVLGIGNNDFYRTRLTHSLEVAQIGTGIVNQLRAIAPKHAHLLPNDSLIESLCLAHDIGHPPFGHGGEVALNYMMREQGGFEGNAQTLRIVTKLEPYTKDHGMNLCRRTLLGVMKYPCIIDDLQAQPLPPAAPSFRQLQVSQWAPVKGIYKDDADLYHWVLSCLSKNDKARFTQHSAKAQSTQRKSLYKSLDCAIMELADDIAYGVHDLEDAIVMGMIDRHDWHAQVADPVRDIQDCWLSHEIDNLSEQLFSRHHYDQKAAIGCLVNAFITAIDLHAQDQFDEPLLDMQARLHAPMAAVLDILKRFVLHYVIQTPDIEIVRFKGQQIVMELHQAFASDPERLLPINTRQRWLDAQQTGNPARIITDYIAGMTDGYAQRLYNQMF